MNNQENKLIVGAVVSTATTSIDDIKRLPQWRLISVENCMEIPAQVVLANCTTRIFLKP